MVFRIPECSTSMSRVSDGQIALFANRPPLPLNREWSVVVRPLRLQNHESSDSDQPAMRLQTLQPESDSENATAVETVARVVSRPRCLFPTRAF
jgi:hypothetical protein